MQFTNISILFACVSTLASAAAISKTCESPVFSILQSPSDGSLHYTTLGYSDQGKVELTGTSFNLTVQADKTVKTSDGRYFVVNDDHSISLGAKDEASVGFSIGSTSDVENFQDVAPFDYDGGNLLVGCPGTDSVFDLYTEKPSGSDDCIQIYLWASSFDGSKLSAFPSA